MANVAGTVRKSAYQENEKTLRTVWQIKDKVSVTILAGEIDMGYTVMRKSLQRFTERHGDNYAENQYLLRGQGID
jgi:hypothetical protein